ncbi:hypothetical protein [Acidisoma sp. L85]|uniref:hypothetical protein n=2 Tax=unclassified Acidisoma TaxID=2634065 RepID=UPI001C20706E|nr:hypothetical protein [Acidisoma sp. L85]
MERLAQRRRITGFSVPHKLEGEMRYKIDPDSDRVFIEEFRRNPVGNHSPGLMRVLNTLRYDPSGRQIVLFCRKPFAEWQIGEMPADRREPLVFEDSPIFTNRDEAEWEIFRRRWRAATGEDINLPLKSPENA